MNEFMALAIEEAKKAQRKGEVPIGAVVVCDGKVVGKGYNKRERKQNALLHAEVVAINKACKKLKSFRLNNCQLYVTLEPCTMCAGAVLNSRINEVYYGASDPKGGAMGTVIDVSSIKEFNHNVKVTNLKNEECSNLLTQFFKNIRENKK